MVVDVIILDVVALTGFCFEYKWVPRAFLTSVLIVIKNSCSIGEHGG